MEGVVQDEDVDTNKQAWNGDTRLQVGVPWTWALGLWKYPDLPELHLVPL